jgi:hypothetical protein
MSQVISDSGVRGFAPALVGGTGTTTKIFPSILGSGFNNGAANLQNGFATNPITVPTAVAGTGPAQVAIRGTGEYEQRNIAIEAGGFVFVHGASPTLNFLFQNGKSLTSGSNTTMATLSSAQSLTTANYYPWQFKASMFGDSLSGVLQISGAVFVCNGVSGTVTLTDITGINLTTTNLQFCIGVTFGVSDSLNVGALGQFNLGT